MAPTQAPPQFYGPHCEKEVDVRELYVTTSKNLIIVSKIQVDQDLATLALNLALDSSTHIRLKNEASCNSCKETK
jgi:hypothetical protein